MRKYLLLSTLLLALVKHAAHVMGGLLLQRLRLPLACRLPYFRIYDYTGGGTGFVAP
jgi:hypothetical protein